jgi:tetratricopeptide (TPR) repeat protein
MLIKREAEAAKLFKEAWKKPLKLDLFIPYHPRLALTEDAYVTTRTASYLRDSYQEIEMRLLMALGQLPGILLNQAKQAILSSSGAPAVSLLERYVKLRNSGSRNTSSQRGFPFSWEISLDLMEEEELLKKTLTLPESLRILELLHITAGSSYRLAEFGKQLHKLEYPQASDFDRLILKSNLLKPDALGNYALFLSDVRKLHDAAESFYKRALDADPKNANNLGSYAYFLMHVRELPAAAESFYKRALDADPKHANNLANYGQFLIGKGETDQGLALLHSAWRQRSKLSNSGIAELAYSLWLANQMTGKDGMAWEKAFKHLILAGFPRHQWNFDAMLKQAEPKLSPALGKYAKALADAFLDETKVAALDQIARWKKLQPMDPKLVE